MIYHVTKSKDGTKRSQNYWVVKANEIARKGRYGYTLQQLQILDYCISKIKPNDTGDGKYTMNIADYCRAAGIHCHSGGNYASLRKNIQALADKSFWLEKDGKLTLMRWLQKIVLEPKTGTIEYTFDPDILPYVANLQSNYTQMELPILLSFRSKYAKRLYEYLKSYYYRVGELQQPIVIQMTVQEFRSMMFVTGYKSFKELRRNVLEKAVNEINDYSDIMLECNIEAGGSDQSITHLIFTLKEPSSGNMILRSQARKYAREK